MLKIYNTKTKLIETFIPKNEGIVNMYVCGPTVYDHIHIGNARPVIFFDFVKTYLEFFNYQVKYVSNITDIDDKIIDKAILENKSEMEITNKYSDSFKEVSFKLNKRLPDLMPKATAYLPEMIQYIKELIDLGYAYTTDEGVYFSVDKVGSYGSLSGQNIDELTENVRIVNESSKKNIKDFTLWKTTDKGLSFESPWSKGRPGWHTECAVMNKTIFNDIIDIHGGGSDLIFPHHENEEAQSIAHDNHVLSNYWMHVGRLDLNNEKMSKSLGNVILVKELLKEVDVNVFRLLILGQHYRLPIKYNDDLVYQYTKIYDKIKNTILKSSLIIKSENITNHNIDDHIILEFKKHMNNDFNTPNVITLILELVKQINMEKDVSKLNILVNTLNTILEIFKVMPEVNIDLQTIKNYQEWNSARINKNYSKADELRKILSEQGWI